MVKISKLWLLIFFIIIKLIKNQTVYYCGINRMNYEVKFPLKKQIKTNDENYRAIQIHLETKSITKLSAKRLNFTNIALNNIIIILQKLIKVKPLNYTFAINENDLNNWGFDESEYNQIITQGIDTDLIVLIKYLEDEESYKMSSEPKYIDEYTKRPIVGIIYLTSQTIESTSKKNIIYYIETLFLHQFTHILGFLYQSFNYFPGGISNVIVSISSDQRSNMPRNYIITPKVVEFAKKYYGCDNIIGVELEDQDGRTNSHWEARTVLGEYMNSDHYIPEQVISEFTLALLEDSGWYHVNYYTGGLFRFGKNKKCNFLNNDCLSPSLFKNEFFNYKDSKPGCSSGRQSRVYTIDELSREGDFENFENYHRFNDRKGGFSVADFCLVFYSLQDEENTNGYYVGNCNKGDGKYGSIINYLDNWQHTNSNFDKELGEEYGYNSFCVLSSASTISARINNKYYQFQNNIIHPMCYPMLCSEKSLTIQINDQFVVCPRSGGKVEINGDYEGYIFCPDYNLICTGTILCNDMFDCVEKKSLIKNSTFYYDYDIKTNQLIEELINEEIEPLSYELSDDGVCPKDCLQCNNLTQCFVCRNGFYYIGVKEGEVGPIYCKNISNISIGYYKTIENHNIIYYPCTNGCDKCNRTHCLQCDNYHKLDENNIFCEEKVKNCLIYENKTFTCIKCRGEYVFIGQDRNICHIIDKKKYYTLDNGTSYYLCKLNISQCDECEYPFICDKCLSPFYFIEENRETCFNDKNLSKYFTEDEGISYIPCYKNFSFCDECLGRFNCTNCKDNYYLLNENGNISCKNINPKKYYKEDIYYYPCIEAINKCDECDQKEKCNKCIDNYYFIEEDRIICRNDKNLSKYYTNDNGISYFPCNKYFEYCDECINGTTCLKCNYSYGFFEQDYSKCIFVGNNKYYSLDGGITFYFCNHSLTNCEECPSNELCSKCKENYYFIKNNRIECLNDKNLSKYYSEDNGISYFPCNESIYYCDSCINKSFCVECESFNGYYFVGNNRSVCRNDINKTKYYTEDNGISYYPCREAIDFCEICQQKNKCDKCINNYFFIGNNRTYCLNDIDYRKFYTNDSGISYYPCNTSIEQCDECFNENICNKCYFSYILLFESPIKCHQESLYINNDNYFKLNETHYKKCSSSIEHCDKCTSYNNCTKCDINYYFLNDDHSKCILENNILPEDEYFKVDDSNYYSCSYEKAIINCQKCTNGTICQKCKEGFAFIYNHYNECVLKTKLEIGYYPNEESTIYYPCLEHCDKCINGYECQQCSKNFSLINDNSLCENCEIRIEYLNSEFRENIVSISNYINFNKNSLVIHYINNIYNYSITIFKAWECTESLLEKDYFKFNTKELSGQMNKILNIDKTNFIYVFINNNYKNYLEIYNLENGQKINIQTDCFDCVQTGFGITNNYTYEVKNELGNIIFRKIKEYNIDIFNKADSYISDVCKNFTISRIDLSVPDRINYIYLGDYSNEIICTDKNCEIQSYETTNFSGTCNCKINSDINYLVNNNINILNQENKMSSYDISFTIFKCIKSGFSSYIFSNSGFYIFLIFIILQILCFIFFIFFENKNFNLLPKKKQESNPPKKENFDNDILFIDNFDIIDNINNKKTKEKGLNENDIQDKDEEEFIEEIYTDELGYEDSSEKDKSGMTELKSEIDMSKRKEKGKRKTNNIKMKGNDTGEVFLDKEDDDYKSKNQLNIEKKYKKIDKNGLNFKYKDFLSFNFNTKNSKNLSKKSDIYHMNTEGKEKEKEKIKKINVRKKKSKSKNYSENEHSVRSKEKIIKLKDNISSIKKSFLSSPDNKSFREAQKDDKLSFCGFYWYLLGLKQPILNLSSQIKILNITESFIPQGIKFIKFIFILGLDFFINSLFISQKYISKKFVYFDNKYNLRFDDLGIDISINERFSYAFKHTILYSVYTFLICYVIQAILNYVYFNLRKRINAIIMTKDDGNIEEQLKEYFETVRTKYKFIFMINIILMLFFWYYIINFTAIYRGGDLDYIAASILSFIFLQIFPFFVCLILALLGYCGLKKSDENIYKISQVLAY